jgi:HSP20 family protein
MANRELTPWRMPGLQAFGRDPFTSFRREMDRLFDDFFAPAEGRSFAPAAAARAETGMIMPSIDVQENEQAYTVTAELPGIDLKDIELSLDDNVLTLRGEKRSERHEEDGGRRYSERSYGRFERSVPLAAEVDPNRVEASCENGVLKVMLPKNPKARETSRRIEIKGAGTSAAGGSAQGSSGQGSSGQGSSGQASSSSAQTASGQSAQGQPQGGAGGAQRPTADI